MTGTVVVVECFEKQYGVEKKRIFKAFNSISLFEQYCLTHDIRIFKGAFGTTYFDDTYAYLVGHVELVT